MERSGCNWSRSVAEEAGVWLEVRHRLAGIDVENLDAMFLCSTMQMSDRNRRLASGILTLRKRVHAHEHSEFANDPLLLGSSSHSCPCVCPTV
jgi:hypothetical protein